MRLIVSSGYKRFAFRFRYCNFIHKNMGLHKNPQLNFTVLKISFTIWPSYITFDDIT